MMNKLINPPLENPQRRCRQALLLLLAIGWATVAAASEVYTWTDESGTVHYSDTPRASGAMEALDVEEIYRPGSSDAYPSPSSTPGAAPGATAEEDPPAPLSAAEQRRQSIASDRAERREKQAEMERQCNLHRQRLEQMEPARRVFYTDEDGESVRMDDDRRVALIEESKAFLAKNCRG